MADGTGRLALEVFVGVQPSEHWARIESSDRPHAGEITAAREGRTWERPALARDSIPWESLGVLPRFVGSETTSCVAALQPSTFYNRGAEEFDRFLQAASRRNEMAVVVSTIGDPEAETFSRSVFSRFDADVLLPGIGSIAGRRLPSGAVPQVADGLTGADHDLAVRLRDAVDVWWAIELQPSFLEGPLGRETREPGGHIKPLLVNSLGETLAGVWIPDADRDLRWYVVPGGADWEMLIAWVVDRAVPELVPGVLRRARSSELVDDELLTQSELTARDSLAMFDREAAAARKELEDALTAATTSAGPLRHDLLYGTGDALKAAVAVVLLESGFTVEDLDETFGAAKSADLLASMDGLHCLVEVKSAGGMPSEGLISDLDRHARTWTALGRSEQLHRSALVVNHQHTLSPLDRAEQPYVRPEFLASLHHVVVPTLALFAWWRDGSHDAVRSAFIREPVQCYRGNLRSRDRDSRPALVDASPLAASPARKRNWWWRR